MNDQSMGHSRTRKPLQASPSQSCEEAEAWVRSRFGSTHNPPPGGGRHCCWRCNGRKYSFTRGAEGRPHSQRPSARNSEAAKALDKRQAHLCVLASNCDEPMYVKLVEALCAEHQINLIKVDDNKKLGEWVGLCKIDREGKPGKVVGCSCVVVKDYGKESQAKDVIEEYFKCKK